MSTTSPDRVADGIERLPLRTPTLPPATHTNTYLVGTDEAILVEPASPYPEEVVRAVHWVKKSGRRLLAIVATHHHIDHVGGAKALAEALEVPLWAHPETAARVPELYFDRHLAADEVLELSGTTPMALRVVFTPGHAPGHICLHAEASGALIAGDMVASVGTILVEPVDGDMTLYLESLRRLIALSPSRILPAHGDPIDETEALLQHYIDHRLWREEKIRKVVIANPGAALDAIVRGAYDDVPPAVLPLARASTEAHLIKLERDGRVTRQRGADGPWWDPEEEPVR
ncbi:MAG: MBL fold metallo-hydrolase [Myxococcota bacterium]